MEAVLQMVREAVSPEPALEVAGQEWQGGAAHRPKRNEADYVAVQPGQEGHAVASSAAAARACTAAMN